MKQKEGLLHLNGGILHFVNILLQSFPDAFKQLQASHLALCCNNESVTISNSVINHDVRLFHGVRIWETFAATIIHKSDLCTTVKVEMFALHQFSRFSL